MDHGKYISMIPIVVSGTIKVFRKDEDGREILLYYLSGNESCSMAYKAFEALNIKRESIWEIIK